MPREVEQLTTQPRDPSPMGDLMETLPTYRSRALIYVLVLLGVVLAVYSAVGKVDILVTAPVTLVPVNPVKPIQIDSEGVVSEVFVQEGKVVAKDDPLIAIDAKELSSYQFALRSAQLELDDAEKDVKEVLSRRKKTMEAQVKAIRERLAALEKGAELLKRRRLDEEQAKADTLASQKLELKKHAETMRRLHVEVKNAQQAAEVWRKETDANARLRGKQVVTEIQFLNVQRSLEEAVASVRKYESMLTEAEAEKGLLEQKYRTALAQHDRTMTDLQEQLDLNGTNQAAALAEVAQREEEYDLAETEAHRKLALAQSRRKQAEQQAKLNMRDAYDPKLVERIARDLDAPSNRLVVKAAEAGTVAKLLVRSPGETVQRGQPLMTIVPSGTLLYAEIRVPNRDIGQVKSGQEVRLKLDAFPFADFGAVEAKLGAPLQDAEAPEGKGGESYYRVHATLDPKYGNPQQIRPLNNINADPKTLLSGMTGSAEVVTDSKTILEMILKPFRELGKPPSAQPANVSAP